MIKTILNDWLNRPTNIYECAQCGTTVDHTGDSCPYCENARIVEFEL